MKFSFWRKLHNIIFDMRVDLIVTQYAREWLINYQKIRSNKLMYLLHYLSYVQSLFA